MTIACGRPLIAALLLGLTVVCAKPSPAVRQGRGRVATMKITLTLADAGPAARKQDGIAIYPMALPVSLTAKFLNDGASTLPIESPRSSQEVLLWLVTGDPEPYWFIMNQSRMDRMGELTAPPRVDLQLAPGEGVDLAFTLQDYNVDRWFEPGVYQVYVEYLKAKSPALSFGTEFAPDSVPKLVALALDSPDSWLRERSIAWLQKLPNGPGLLLPAAGSDQAQTAAVQAQNRERAKAFLDRWPAEKETKPVKDFFESVRTKVRT